MPQKDVENGPTWILSTQALKHCIPRRNTWELLISRPDKSKVWKKWLHLVISSSATPIIASKYHITTVLCNPPWLLSLQSSIFAPGTQNVVQISGTKMELHYPKPQKPFKKKRGFQTKSFQAFEEASTCFRSNDFGERTPNLHSEFDGIGCSLGPQIVPQFPGMMCRHDMWCVCICNDKW